MSLYERQFSPDLDIADAPPARRTLVIASSPRCGSHMLGHSLAETGCLGVPFEYCNPAVFREWQARLGTEGPEETLAAIMARRTTTNGIFAIKMHYPHTRLLGGAREALQFFPDPVVVRIRRRDLLRQAISFARARQTGIWIDGQEGTGRTPRYNRELLDDCLKLLVWQEAGWQHHLAASGTPTLAVEFEAFRADVAGYVREIANFTGVELEADVIPAAAPTRRQSEEDNTREWIAKYVDDGARPPRKSMSAGLRRLVKRIRSVRHGKP